MHLRPLQKSNEIMILTQKLKGYQLHRRDRHLIAKRLNLDNEEYRLWDLLAALSGWDKNHEDKFQVVEANNSEIGKIVGWSESTISRVIRRLESKRVIKKICRGRTRINVRAVKGSEEEDEAKLAAVKDELAVVQDKVASVQVVQEEAPDSSLVSSKVNNILRINDRTDEDYQRIYLEGGYRLLKPDDMRWIDQNIGRGQKYGRN